MSVIILHGEMIHYEVLGRGRPIVFLHSWIGSWRYWIPTMQSASTSYRAYAIDFRGFGDTAKNPGSYASGYTRKDQANLIYEFLQELGIGKIALVGHGLGAMVALDYALLYPGQVDRMMAISLPVDHIAVNPTLSSTNPTALAEWLLGNSQIHQAARLEAPKTDPQAIQGSLENLETAPPGKLQLLLTSPCLLVYGMNDPLVNEPGQAAAAMQPENIHQITFEQSGHFPMLDEPNKFNRLLVDFLALPSGTSPRQLQLKEEWKRRVR